MSQLSRPRKHKRISPSFAHADPAFVATRTHTHAAQEGRDGWEESYLHRPKVLPALFHTHSARPPPEAAQACGVPLQSGGIQSGLERAQHRSRSFIFFLKKDKTKTAVRNGDEVNCRGWSLWTACSRTARQSRSQRSAVGIEHPNGNGGRRSEVPE